MSTAITVLKFGGSSLEDSAGFARVANVLRSCADTAPVAVVSAMSGVTDALLKILRAAETGDGSAGEPLLEEVLRRHLEVAARFGPTSAAEVRQLLANTRDEIIDLVTLVADRRTASPRSRDAMTSYGELLSAQLVTLFLNEQGLPASYVDARRCILTNGEHNSAMPMIRESTIQTRAQLHPLLQKKRVPVLGGYIGATSRGVTTTMGRGSSDFTATLVSAALNARETQIWTDVDGVKTADPRLVKAARTIPHLSYDEAEEMARLGAKVLHQRMMGPVRAQEIPIRICNSYAPQEHGTLIGAQAEGSLDAVKAIAHKNNLTRIDVTASPASVANGLQRSIAEVFDRHQNPCDIIARSGDGLSLTCDENGSLSAIVHDLEQHGSVAVTRGQAIISCVGEGLRSVPGGATRTAATLKAIDSTLTWQRTSGLNVMSVVDADLVGPLVRQLHRALFEEDR